MLKLSTCFCFFSSISCH